MFTIGIFSTHLPYILLAMFYGAYIGFNTIVRSHDENTESATGKKIIQKNKAEDSFKSQSTCYYYDFIAVNEGVKANKCSFYLERIPKPPTIPLHKSTYFKIYLSRPPPSGC